jgi:predicted DNA-binding ribbon-helix-helix protein
MELSAVPHLFPPQSSSVRSFLVTTRQGVSLEDAFWNALREIANERDMTLSKLIKAIDTDRQHANLSSAIRLFVLGYYRDQISDRQGGTQKRVAA